MHNKRAAIYIRYGKAAQNKKMDELDEFVKGQESWSLVYRYIDDGFSAKDKDRPALKTDIVCIKGVHQLSRDTLAAIEMFKLFNDCGVKVFDVLTGRYIGLVG